MCTAAALAALALAGPAAAAERGPSTDLDKTLYAVGVAAADSFRTFDLTAEELEMVQRGLRDALTGEPVLVDMAAYRARVDALAAERRAAQERRLAARYAGRRGAQAAESGLVFVPVAAGTGPAPTAEDVVKVHYLGRLGDGTVFDSTARKGAPATVPLEQAIRCWKEALPRMRVGGKAELVCPPSLAYGERGMPRAIPPNATLFFEIELLSIPARIVITDKPIPGTMPDQRAAGEGAGRPAASPAAASAPNQAPPPSEKE